MTPLAIGRTLTLMEIPLAAETLLQSSIGRPEGVLKAVVESFKLKLAAYFSLISLLPLAAAFWGFDAVTGHAETGRADSVLHGGLRGALATYAGEVAAAEDAAERVAREPALQRALAAGDSGATALALRREPNVRVVGRGFAVGHRPALAAERSVTVTGRRGALGRVVGTVPVTHALGDRLAVRSGLADEQELLFLQGGRPVDVQGAPAIAVPSGKPRTVKVGSKRYRVLVSEPLPAPKGVRLAILTPQSRIDAAVTAAEGRLFVPLLIALVLIALLAYVEGRSIVRTLGALVEAARGIAQGKLDERVPVKGRDEFADLGRAFNEMADQLQARLGELEAERTRVRDATMRFGEALAATHDPDELLRVIVETAVEATGAAGGYLDGSEGSDLAAGDPNAEGERLRFPIATGREHFGTLVLIGDRLGNDSRETATWLVGHAAIALANARKHRTVEKQALVDPLTGLPNRRVAEGALETELSRAGRFGDPLAMIMSDLDDFKQINDRWGHPFGDVVLREFAAALADSIRDIDLAGRWGGEEFAVVLPGTDLEGGAALAERIRANLRARALVAPDGEPVEVTASFGVAAYPLADTRDELVAAADAALYDAKRGGKDRVARAAPVSEPPAPVA
jgi:diguanylate cyclase (GGDEF)-like protein